MHSISLQPAKTHDILVIHGLAQIIWRQHYPSIIGVKQVEYMLDRMYSAKTLGSQISEGIQHYFMIQDDARPVGFIAFEKTGESGGFINKFYVLQSTQRKGTGKVAFQLLIARFPEADEIKLQVNRMNIQAINFYFKVGFSIESATDFDIGSGYFMNDFIMCWKK